MKRTLFLPVLAVLMSCLSLAKAQEAGKIEAGLQFSLLRQGDRSVQFTTPNIISTGLSSLGSVTGNDLGFGGRFGYNLNRFLSLEAEVDFFPVDHAALNDGTKVEALFGAKVGGRVDRVGLFGKVRPGFIYFSREDNCGGLGSFVRLSPSCGGTGTHFALDAGVVLEIELTPRSFVRIDAGDLVIWHEDRTFPVSFTSLPTPTPIPVPGPIPLPVNLSARFTPATTHNFQLSLGLGVRF